MSRGSWLAPWTQGNTEAFLLLGIQVHLCSARTRFPNGGLTQLKLGCSCQHLQGQRTLCLTQDLARLQCGQTSWGCVPPSLWFAFSGTSLPGSQSSVSANVSLSKSRQTLKFPNGRGRLSNIDWHTKVL